MTYTVEIFVCDSPLKRTRHQRRVTYNQSDTSADCLGVSSISFLSLSEVVEREINNINNHDVSCRTTNLFICSNKLLTYIYVKPSSEMVCMRIVAAMMVVFLMATVVRGQGPANMTRLFSIALCLSREYQVVE